MNGAVAGLKKLGLMVGGIGIFVLTIGLWATCQFAQGQVRPYLPPIVRDLVTNPEDTFVVEDYLKSVDRELESLLEDAEACSARRDQPCLTAAFESAYEDLGDGVPIEAAWISGAHGRLRDALYAMWQVHRRSETEPVTEGLLDDSLDATDELAEAVDEWYRQTRR